MPKRRRQLSYEETEKLNEVKRHLCCALRRSMGRKNHPSQTAFALLMGTSRSCVCKVQCAEVESLTINQLMTYLVKMEPHFQILIAI